MNLLRHAAALTLVGWYLMVPPTPFPRAADSRDVLTPYGTMPAYSYFPNAPLATWEIVGKFKSLIECEKTKGQRQKESRDIENNLAAMDAEPGDGVGEQAENDKFMECVSDDDPRLKKK